MIVIIVMKIIGHHHEKIQNSKSQSTSTFDNWSKGCHIDDMINDDTYLSQSCLDDTFEYFSNSYLVSLWCQYFCFLETYSSLSGWIQNGKAVTTSHKLHKITKFSDTFPEKRSNNVGEEEESKVGENIMHRSSPKWRLNCFPSRYIKCGAILGNVPICVKGCWWKGRLCDGVRFVRGGLVEWQTSYLSFSLHTNVEQKRHKIW